MSDEQLLRYLHRLHDAGVINLRVWHDVAEALAAGHPLEREQLTTMFRVDLIAPLITTPGERADRVLLRGQLEDIAALLCTVEAHGMQPLERLVEAQLRLVAVVTAALTDRRQPSTLRPGDRDV